MAVMTATDSFYNGRYGMVHKGQAFEVDDGDVAALIERGQATEGGEITKMEEQPANKAITSDDVPNKRRRKPATKESPEVIPVPSPTDGPELDTFVEPGPAAEITEADKQPKEI
jgi:hypothetical protein